MLSGSKRVIMSRQFVTILGNIIGCLVFLSSNLLTVQSSTAQSVEDFINQLEWRNIGPANMGGRINDFAVGAGVRRTASQQHR